MSTVWDREQVAKPLNDIKVDNYQGQSDVIDTVPSLSLNLDDEQLIKNIQNRVQDSKDYWDTPDGFNLAKVRGDNERVYLGKQTDVRSLYRFQMPYIENQVYIAEQAIMAYLTAREPQSEVMPAKDTPMSRQFALDLEKIHMAHSQKMNLGRIMENVVRNALNKRIGLIKFEFDPDYGKDGEIIPIAVNPEHVVIDKNARQGENPAFIDMTLKMSINEMCHRWPEKKEEIYNAAGIKRGTYKQREEIVAVHETYITYYDKKYEPHEALVYYFADVILEKTKNPHYIYSDKKRNFFDMPVKPYIALNFDNDGTHWIDITSAIEQAQPLQSVLNKRGRQLMEVADKANGLLVVSSDSGLSKDDLQNLTGDPNQRLIIKTLGKSTQDMVYQVPPPVVPQFLYQDKIDLRTQVANLMGAPVDFSGIDSPDNEKNTLGQTILKKNQASGRQDLYVRAIDRFSTMYYNYLTQMMVVWYNKDHYFIYNGGDGNYDHLVANRYLFEDGIAVAVKAGSTPPLDKQREEIIAMNLSKDGLLAPLDVYRLLHLQTPQKLYDNWAKFKSDPMTLARDALEEIDQTKAYMAWTMVKNGEKPEDPKDCTKEFVLTLRKIMLTDDFLQNQKSIQNAFIKFVEKALQSLEARTSLDQMAEQGVEMLDVKQPIQPPQPPQPPMGGMPPQMPNAQPMPMGAPMPPAPQMMPPQNGPFPLPPQFGQNPAPMMPPAPQQGAPAPTLTNAGQTVRIQPNSPTQLPNL